LKHLLSLKDLSDTEIAANVYTWLGTGAETPANAMAYTIYLLSLHPECEAKVVKEISSSDGPFPYLDACCQESMRLMSPASKILRQATSEVTLPNGIRLNKGTKFQVSLRMAMLDPEAWFEPLKFNPMRFVDKDETTSNFVAWGGGNRLCIGMKFAEKMMRSILSCLLREFRFELEPGQVPLKVQTGLTMTPVDGIRMRVSRRQD
jgi:thromboxane-A synthase